MISEDTLNYGRDYNILNKISKELSVPPFSRHFLLPSTCSEGSSKSSARAKTGS